MAQTKETTETKQQAQYSSAALRAVLIQPRLSEKSSILSKSGKYVFKVTLGANKVEVKKAIEKAYNVKVVQVNIIRMQGKQRTYGRASGKTSDFKKAIVTLKPGQTIEGLTENI